jgi:hypothetical protein
VKKGKKEITETEYNDAIAQMILGMRKSLLKKPPPKPQEKPEHPLKVKYRHIGALAEKIMENERKEKPFYH